MKKIIFILATLSFILSACGGTPVEETPPPVTGEDIQTTAISMAWTMAAQTQTAIPTETFTPLPPTETFTPVFTATPLFTATAEMTNTPLPTATVKKDACNKALSEWGGTETKILVVNETDSAAVISLFLYQHAHGYCGYRSATIAKHQRTTFVLPVGYYSASAWEAPGETQHFNYYLDLTGVLNPDLHTLYIRKDKLQFATP